MFQAVKNAYSHHQKCVLVDTQEEYGNNRKITAFIGGLDLTDGRYDTPEHRLFQDLDTVFKDDIHQPTSSVSGYNISSSISVTISIINLVNINYEYNKKGSDY